MLLYFRCTVRSEIGECYVFSKYYTIFRKVRNSILNPKYRNKRIIIDYCNGLNIVLYNPVVKLLNYDKINGVTIEYPSLIITKFSSSTRNYFSPIFRMK